jgi:MFS family permease
LFCNPYQDEVLEFKLIRSRPVHLASLATFFIGSLLCGLSKSMVLPDSILPFYCSPVDSWLQAQLIVFRGVAGFGGGGVLVCVMAIMSDVVSLKNRGKLQGVVGLDTILANGIGPTFGGILAEHGWRWVCNLTSQPQRELRCCWLLIQIFWVVCPPTALSFVQCLLWLPLKQVHGDKKKMFRQVDFLGVFCQLGAVIFILVRLDRRLWILLLTISRYLSRAEAHLLLGTPLKQYLSLLSDSVSSLFSLWWKLNMLHCQSCNLGDSEIVLCLCYMLLPLELELTSSPLLTTFQSTFNLC